MVSGENEEPGGVGGASLTEVSVQGQGAGRVQAKGKTRFPQTRPSFFSAFLSNTIPFRNGLEGDQLGPGLCAFSFWLPQTSACVTWPQARVGWTVTSGVPVTLRQRSWSHLLLDTQPGLHRWLLFLQKLLQ